MSYATNLCDLMQSRGISSYKLAKEVGVHVSTVTNWKDGSNPKIEHVKKVADYFGVT
ncbi:MAG: helix-turn-helix domain-containing protein, partial [Streptococcus sp.]